MPFCCCTPAAAAAVVEEPSAFSSCERLVLAAFLEPAAAACRPEWLVFAPCRGLPPCCPRRRLAVTFRAFAMYRAATWPRALPSFRQRSISYALPSSPNVLVLTSFVSSHTSQVSFTLVTVVIVLFPTVSRYREHSGYPSRPRTCLPALT